MSSRNLHVSALASLTLALLRSPGLHAESESAKISSAHATSPCGTNRALGVAVAVVPGVVVHGLGHFVTCEPAIGRRLLFLQGVGVTTTVLSGVGLALSGASRYVVAPLALGAIGGVGLFAISYLADVYGVLSPSTGIGSPARHTPALVLQSGVRLLHDPLFPTSFLLSQGFLLDAAGFWLAPRIDASPDGRHRRYALAAGHPLFGAHGDRRLHRPWWVDLRVALRDFAESREGFGMTSAEVALVSRVDLELLGHTLRGSFGLAELGYSREWHRFDGAPGFTWDALLARVGFGTYLGGAVDPASGAVHGVQGETFFAYDHRRDTVAGGMRVSGIPAGYLGFLEQRTELYFGPRFGAALELQYGSAAVVSGYFLMRLPKGS